MRRVLSLAAALLAVGALPAQAHDAVTAARLGAEVQAAMARAGVVPASPVARVSGPRTLKLAVMPIQVNGAVMPTPAELTKAVADLNGVYLASTGGTLKAVAVYAPVYATTVEVDELDTSHVLARTVAAAAAHHVSLTGATPVFIAASPSASSSFGGPALGALLFGNHWKLPSFWAHEIGHWLGLSHGRAPLCPTPGSILGCNEKGGIADEYGDYFDIMGNGADRFGAFQLRVLGLKIPPDAAAGPVPAVAKVAPPGLPGPGALRIRAASRDWFVEARSESHYEVFFNGDPLDLVHTLPAGGVIVSRAERRYTTDEFGYFPNPYRYAPDVGAPCDPAGEGECAGAAEVFVPGKVLTVPGAFRLDVLPAAPDGTSQVRTTWLDTTPPVLKTVRGRLEKPWGATSSTLVVDLAGSADGAGIAAAEVKSGSKITRLDADSLLSLATGNGKATVRMKAPRSGIVRTTLVDAAGKRSAIKSLKVSKLKTTRTNALTYAPKGGAGYYTSAHVAAGTRIRVSVRMDPKLRGIPIVIGFFGPKGAVSKQVRLSRTGRAAASVALPKGVGIPFFVQLPRKRGTHVSWVQQPNVYYTAE